MFCAPTEVLWGLCLKMYACFGPTDKIRRVFIPFGVNANVLSWKLHLSLIPLCIAYSSSFYTHHMFLLWDLLVQGFLLKRQYCITTCTIGCKSVWLRVPSNCGRGDPLCTHTETSLPSFLNNSFQLLHLLITKGAGKTNGLCQYRSWIRNVGIKSLVTTDNTPKFQDDYNCYFQA